LVLHSYLQNANASMSVTEPKQTNGRTRTEPVCCCGDMEITVREFTHSAFHIKSPCATASLK